MYVRELEDQCEKAGKLYLPDCHYTRHNAIRSSKEVLL